jgi:hypothetical protein
MSSLLNLVPYVLAGLTILLGIFQLIKEWDEYDKLRFPWLRRAALAVLILIAALTFVSLHLDSNEKEKQRSKSEADIRELKGKVEEASKSQKDNTDMFLGSLGKMSKEVSDLRTEVKTEALQKRLASVQADLQKTQKALAPSPKAELEFTFLPFNNPPSDSSVFAGPVTDTDLPMNADGSVHIEGGALNMTSVDAASVDLNIQICDLCKYAKEPANTIKLKGFPDTIRELSVPHVQGMQVFTPITLDIIPPPNASNFTVGFNYRCSTCVVTSKASVGMSHFGQVAAKGEPGVFCGGCGPSGEMQAGLWPPLTNPLRLTRFTEPITAVVQFPPSRGSAIRASNLNEDHGGITAFVI